MINKYIHIAFVAVMLFKSANAVYLSTKCGYHGPDYSIKWAFEPQTQSIVFVLKTMPPRNLSREGMLVTGVAFETEKHSEFIGVAISKENSGKMKVIGAKAEGTEGQFELNSNDIISKVREITVKKRPNGDVIAEFARPLKGEKERELLNGCKTFQFPTKWTWIPSGSSTFSLMAKQSEICEIAENCLLDVQELKKKIKHLDTSFHVDISHSVDVSGKGDPCSFKNENYEVKWEYDSKTTAVNFVMRQKAKSGKWWSAVGIGDNMSDMDIGVVFLDGGVPVEMGDYYSNSYGVPEKDKIQDWRLNKSESKWGGKSVELHFSRQLITKDTEKDRSLDGCVLFQFVANGGTYGDGYSIHKHENWPDLYKACDLKKQCVKSNDQSNESNDEISQQINIDKPEISHSNDGTNRSQLANEKQQQLPNANNENGKKANSTSVKIFDSNKVETVEEKKGQKNNTNLSKENEEQMKKTTAEKDAKLKPLKKREENGTANADVETNYGFSENRTFVGEIYTAEETAKNDSINQRSVGGSVASGGESPFSLNAFLGNQTDGSNFSPVGESLLGLAQNDTKDGAKFGIGQLIGIDEKGKGNGISLANETTNGGAITSNEAAEIKNGTTMANSTLENEKKIENPNEALNSTVIDDNFTSAHNNNNTANGSSPSILPTEGEQTEIDENESPDGNGNSQSNNTIPVNSVFESTLNETNPSNFQTKNATETTVTTKETSTISPTVNEVNITVTTITAVQTLDDDQKPNGTFSTGSTIEQNELNATKNETTTEDTDIEKANDTNAEMTTLPTTVNATITVEHDFNITTVADEQKASNVVEETTETIPSSTTIVNSTERGETNEITEKVQQNTTSVVQSSNIEKGNGEEQIIRLPVSKSKCENVKPDLPICKSYMDNYLGRVQEWADKHGELMGQQFGKACKLLAAVPHVPTLCCQIFEKNCVSHL